MILKSERKAVKISNEIGEHSINHILKVLGILSKINLRVNEELTVENNSSLSGPWYIPNSLTIFLHTNISGDYYQQVTYQFAHEVMHHIVYEKANINFYTEKQKDMGEILSTAFSFYVLSRFILNKSWDEYLQSEIQRLKDGTSLYSKFCDEILNEFELFNLDQNNILISIDKAVKELIAVSKQ